MKQAELETGKATGGLARLVLPLLALLLAACAVEPEEPPPPGYYYTPYGYYDVAPWDPYYDPWFWSSYDGYGYCCGFGWYPAYSYGYWGGGYYHGWGHGWGGPGGPSGHGPGWRHPPWGGNGPFPRPQPPGASHAYHPRFAAPHPVRSFSHSHR